MLNSQIRKKMQEKDANASRKKKHNLCRQTRSNLCTIYQKIENIFSSRLFYYLRFILQT